MESKKYVMVDEYFQYNRHTIICVLEDVDLHISTVIVGIQLLPWSDNRLAKGSIEFVKSSLVLCSGRDRFLKLSGY